ncbi:MAG TPA: glycosyltransferase [Bacteroidales bacterium]|nr:glycosyltransferase [Bacteroidales bacterium]
MTYNHSYQSIEKTIQSVVNTEIDWHLFIIDNSETDIISQYLKDDRISYYKNIKNEGFGAAHNRAIEYAILKKAKYHLVLNPDIYFDNDVLIILLNYMNENKNIGLLMPRILYPSGETQFLPKLLPNPLDLVIRRLFYNSIYFKKRMNRYEMKEYCDYKTFESPIISGCFSLFRIDAILTTGLYDTRYFMYFEDFDISRRIHENYKTIYYHRAHVYHGYERGAAKKMFLFKIFIISAMKYFNKWGWFFDSGRQQINRNTILKIKKT